MNTTNQQPTTALPGARFFDAVRRWNVVRPDDGRWVAGVCAGLARRWGMSPLAVRGLFLLFSLITGIGLVAYGVLWLLLPHPDGRIHAQRALSGVISGGFVGAVLLILFDGPLDARWSNEVWHGAAGWHYHGPALLPVLVVGGLILWLVSRIGRNAHRR